MTPFLFLNDFTSKSVTGILGTPENNWTQEYQLLGDCSLVCVSPPNVLERSLPDPRDIRESLKSLLHSGIFIVLPSVAGLQQCLKKKKGN